MNNYQLLGFLIDMGIWFAIVYAIFALAYLRRLVIAVEKIAANLPASQREGGGE